MDDDNNNLLNNNIENTSYSIKSNTSKNSNLYTIENINNYNIISSISKNSNIDNNNNNGLLYTYNSTKIDTYDTETDDELKYSYNSDSNYSHLTRSVVDNTDYNINNLNKDLTKNTINTLTQIQEEPVTKLIDCLGMTNYQFKILLLGLFMCFSYGSEIVVISLITRRLEKTWHLNDIKKASLGGALFYGFLFGALFSGNLMSKKGRKFCFNLGSWLFLFFGISSAFSNEFYSFMFYRIGVGIGLGLIIPTTLTFITEMSPSYYRGYISNIIWIGYSMGELFMCYIAKIFPLDNKFSQQLNWSLVIIFASTPILINIFIINIINESPKYSFSVNDFQEGLFALQEMKEDADIKGNNVLKPEEAKKIEIYYRKLNANLKQRNKKSIQFYKLFTSDNLKKSLITFALTIIISFLFFSLLYIIPELVGKTVENVNFHDLVRTVVYATVFEAIGILCAFTMEIKSIGRLGAFRISLTISLIFSLLCLISEKNRPALLFFLKGIVTVANRVLFVYLPESYSTELRGEALGIAQTLTKLIGITCPILCQLLLSYSIFSMFIFLSLASFIGVILSFIINKETLGAILN